MPERKGPITFKTFLRNTVLDVMRSRGWRETDSETDWDFNWADVGWLRENYDGTKFQDYQRLNHYRNHYELTRKDLMVKNFKRMKKALEREGKADEAGKFDFFPSTFSLPQDWALFELEFKRRPNAVWIMKPPAKAQGKGIFLFTKLSQVSEWRNRPQYLFGASGTGGGSAASMGGVAGAIVVGGVAAGRTGGKNTSPNAVASSDFASQQQETSSRYNKDGGNTTIVTSTGKVTPVAGDVNRSTSPDNAPEPYLAQRYIANPHLIGGKKYDMRIFVLVTSFFPLVIWLHRTGFCRFCHSRFSMADIDNTYIHVTNVAIQKTNPKYAPTTGCKWGIRNLRQYLNATISNEASCRVFSEIQAMILRSIQSVQRIIIQDKHCAELYGYDVMLDNQMKPILIETNASPSLTAETAADYHLKFNLLEDYFNVIDLEGKRIGSEIRVGGFDKIWDNGPVGVTLNDPNATAIQSYLGCLNEYEIPLSSMILPPKLAVQLGGSEQHLT